MQKKKIELQLTANPQKTPQQLQFESQWKEPEKKVVEAPPPQPLPRQQPTSSQPTLEKFDKDEDFEDSVKLMSMKRSFEYDQFGQGSSQNFKAFKSSQNFKPFESFDHDASIGHNFEPLVSSVSNFLSTSGGIPGLDIPQECEELPVETIELDLDPDQDYFPEDLGNKLDVPPMPNFNKRNQTIVDILDILDNPGRQSRPPR